MLKARQKIYSRSDLRPRTLASAAQISTAFRLARDFNRQHRRDKCQGPITHGGEKVLRAILYMGRKQGDPPTYDDIAACAGVSRSTVRRALGPLERAGILTWWNTFVRRRIRGTVKLVRDANAYIVTVLLEAREKIGGDLPEKSKVHSEPTRSERPVLNLSDDQRSPVNEALWRLGRALGHLPAT